MPANTKGALDLGLAVSGGVLIFGGVFLMVLWEKRLVKFLNEDYCIEEDTSKSQKTGRLMSNVTAITGIQCENTNKS